MTTASLVIDAVDLTTQVINGEDPTAKLKGMALGEGASQVTEALTKKKLGNKGAEAVGAIVGKVVGDVTEHLSEQPKVDGYTGAGHKNKLDKP